MSEKNGNKASQDPNDVETTIVNTASVAAKTHGEKAESQTPRPATSQAPASANSSKNSANADSSPLIPEPASRAESTPHPNQPSASPSPSSPRQPESSSAPGNTAEQGSREPSSSVRQKARSLAHSLGDLVGLSEDSGEEEEDDNPADASSRENTPAGSSSAGDGCIRSDAAREQENEEENERLTGKHPEFNNAFDIIDQMEGELEDARQVLFHSSQVRVDQQEMLDHLNELRDVLPVQLERASALMREAEQRRQEASAHSDKIIRSAHDEKDRILEEAHHRADVLAGQENVVALARRKAQSILRDANARARKLTQGADTYVENVLSALNDKLADFAKQTRGGMTVLRQREQEASRQFDQTREKALHPNAAPTPATGAPQEAIDASRKVR